MTVKPMSVTEPIFNGVGQNGHAFDVQALSADGQWVSEAEYWAHYYAAAISAMNGTTGGWKSNRWPIMPNFSFISGFYRC